MKKKDIFCTLKWIFEYNNVDLFALYDDYIFIKKKSSFKVFGLVIMRNE